MSGSGISAQQSAGWSQAVAVRPISRCD